MSVYSPSQTAVWSFCPWRWQLEHEEHWRRRDIEKRDLAALLGQAFSKSMDSYNSAAMGVGLAAARQLREVTDGAVARGLSHISNTLQAWQDAGLVISDWDRAHGLEAKLTRIVTKFIEEDPTPADWVVVASERARPDWGGAACDVVYRRPDGGISVVDYKTKDDFNRLYLEKTSRRHGQSGQRWHYHHMEGADEVWFYLVTLPWGVYPYRFVYDAERGAQWLAQQKEKWRRLFWAAATQGRADGAPVLTESDSHADEYGDCPMAEACLELHRDRDRMRASGYMQLERRR